MTAAKSERKGILLAGGLNSRLYPATLATAKSLLPVYDRPLIYYPLTTLMQADIREILIIAAPQHLEAHRTLLGGGEQWGARFSYLAQEQPRGIADAFVVGRDFVGGHSSALLLADNIYCAADMPRLLAEAAERREGATVFAVRVADPRAFGVAEFDGEGRVIGLEEKPSAPKSPFAVTGCYFYDGDAADIAAALKPSARGELEITDLNREYLRRGKLRVCALGEDAAWFDAGSPESLLDAANFVCAAQKKKNSAVACPEETAWRNGWIDADNLHRLAATMDKTDYGRRLRELAEGKRP